MVHSRMKSYAIWTHLRWRGNEENTRERPKCGYIFVYSKEVSVHESFRSCLGRFSTVSRASGVSPQQKKRNLKYAKYVNYDIFQNLISNILVHFKMEPIFNMRRDSHLTATIQTWTKKTRKQIQKQGFYWALIQWSRSWNPDFQNSQNSQYSDSKIVQPSVGNLMLIQKILFLLNSPWTVGGH